ncbi:MAG: ABC transporter permease [Ilumatobacter sp.]|uniref:ABC transporter permease n=1 Tax=Ilumatobacter sp. TaxID=1967498 RepID=UPI0032985C92
MTTLEDPRSGPTAPTSRRSVATTHTWPASVGLMRRSLVNIVRLPSAFIPSIMMPIFQAIAFSGTFFAIIQIPGFPTDRSINWFLPLGVVMGSGFAGIGIGFATIRDLEGGFYDRLRLTPAPRMSLVTGPLLAALFRSAIVTTVVFVVGSLFGARLEHGPLGLLPLYAAGLGISAIGTGWGLGLAYRFRDMRAAAIMQLTFFLVIFLTEAQTPLFIMRGWLEGVTRINPFNNVIRLSRLGFLDAPMTWDHTWGGLLALAGFIALTMLFARRGLSRLSDG